MHTSTIDIPQEKIEQFKKDAYFILESVIPDEHLELFLPYNSHSFLYTVQDFKQ